MRWWSTVAFFVLLTITVPAQEHPCTPQLSQRADSAVDALTSWDRVYNWYRKYRQCDDGGPAEGVSEAVARNLVDRWDTLPRLAELARNATFRHFVLKHLDETLNADDLKKISTNAAKRCPAGLDSLCRELKKKTDAP